MQVSAEHEARLCAGLTQAERHRLIGLLSGSSPNRACPPAFTRESSPPAPTTGPNLMASATCRSVWFILFGDVDVLTWVEREIAGQPQVLPLHRPSRQSQDVPGDP